MKNGIVGIDFDFTIAKPRCSFLSETERRLRLKSGTLKPMKKYGLSGYRRSVRNKIIEVFEDPLYMGDMQLLPFAGMFVDWLNNRGNTVYIVSARHEKVRNVTRRFITNRLAIDIRHIFFVNPFESKRDAFSALNLDCWIDDNEIDIQTAVDLDIAAFHIVKTPWGENVVDGAKRVNGLYNIMDFFTKGEKDG